MPTLTFTFATPADAAEIAALRIAVADDLTRKHGRGHWSGHTTERGVMRGIKESRVILARDKRTILGVLRLATKKPWAIDLVYFTPVKRALYLIDMAVSPDVQGKGIGRRLLDEAHRAAAELAAQAIRLDAYDAVAGAGGFYAACGYAEVGRKSYRGVPLIYYELLISPASRSPADAATRRRR